MLEVDYEDGEQVQVAWAAITEPEDHLAAAACRLFGAAPALQLVAAERENIARECQKAIAAGAEPDLVGRVQVKWPEALSRWAIRARLISVPKILAETRELGATILIPTHPKWPSQLFELGDSMPPALWIAGNAELLQAENSVAFVGARDCTEYARNATQGLAQEIAESGLPVVSGGALGIDAAAHQGALQTDSGTTVAVLCGGLGRLYPVQNEQLLLEVARHGCLVCESPPDARPARWRFKKRNRLIAALAQGTVVGEASWRSGALSTARIALDLGRPVGAIPGQIMSPAAVGSNQLLRDGAAVITCGRDILDMFGIILDIDAPYSRGPLPSTGIRTAAAANLDPLQVRTYEALPQESRAELADIARSAGLSIKETASALYGLQLARLVVKEEAGWRRAS